MPAACALPTAETTGAMIAASSTSGIGPARSKNLASVSPSRKSMTMAGEPSSRLKMSCTSTTFGCRTALAARASRTKRRSVSGLATSAFSNLIATRL